MNGGVFPATEILNVPLGFVVVETVLPRLSLTVTVAPPSAAPVATVPVIIWVVAAAGVVVVVAVVVAVPAAPPAPPHPARADTASANKNDIEYLIILLPEKRFCTLSPPFTLSA